MIYRADITDWPHLPTLWHEVFGDQWPFTPDLMQRAIIVPGGTQPREVLLAERDGRLVGFAVLEHDPSAPMGSRTGCLVALGVVPQARRRGIGSELHRVALDQFLAYGVRTLQLGGGSPRLWPGVPHALPEARAFFAAQGWIADDTTVDMIQHLGAYETPPALRERSLVLEIHVDVVATEQLDELLAFIAREFPSWLEDYRRIAALGDMRDLRRAGPLRSLVQPITPGYPLAGAPRGRPRRGRGGGHSRAPATGNWNRADGARERDPARARRGQQPGVLDLGDRLLRAGWLPGLADVR
jgi:GNAT superfamily N-acetyltransferase